MLGIHDHSTNQHDLREIVATFIVTLCSILYGNYQLTGAFPTMEAFYGVLLGSAVATFAFYGINTINVKRKTKKQPKISE